MLDFGGIIIVLNLVLCIFGYLVFRSYEEKDATYLIWIFGGFLILCAYLMVIYQHNTLVKATVIECYTTSGNCNTNYFQKKIIKEYELELAEKEIINKVYGAK